MIIEFIKRYPFFFTIWFHLYRKNRGIRINFFTKETVFCIDGYPRSGNTFSLFLIKNLWPDIQIVHHLHALAAIKIAKSKKLPVFCLLRDPLNTISSWYLKSHVLKSKDIRLGKIDLNYLAVLTKRYILYNDFLLKELRSNEIILFEDLIKEPAKIMFLINETAIPEKMKYDYKTLESKVNKIKNQPFGAKDKMGASLPTQEKENAKEKIQQYLKSSDLYKKSNDIYQQIILKKTGSLVKQ